jgi:pyrimidine operon attenuation protein/uracil phosphoribosyltransferase
MPNPTNPRPLLDQAGMAACIKTLADQICADAQASGIAQLALLGLHNRGVPMAQRIAAAMQDKCCANVNVGTIDVTQYRDDLKTMAVLPKLVGSDIPFDVNDALVVLCDEVLYTGRTIRAAIDELLDHGRPRCVKLAVLVERPGREFPIQPDFVGLHTEAAPHERVRVRFHEIDGVDKVFIETSTLPEA